jgi:hypothetical protein
MFGLFQRCTARLGSRERVFLQLESLERRDQPDGNPAIVNFAAQGFGNGLYQITGTVLDANPGGLVVTLGGDSAVIGQTATTNIHGTFSLNVQLQPGDTDPGVITATTVDAQGLLSQPVQLSVNTPPAIVDFTAEEMGNGLFLITGTVLDANPGGLVVTIGGSTSANGSTTTTYDDGSFSMLVQLQTDGTDSGFITATTVDAQGIQSQPVQVFVTPTVP